MDGDRFDAWTRAIGAAHGRRSALRWLAAGVLGGAVAGAGRGAAAQDCRELRQRCERRAQCCGHQRGDVRCGRVAGACGPPDKRCCAVAGAPCRGETCNCCRDLVCGPNNRCVDFTP